ncbi:helix-turn-helix domain-containing protein [Ligilactobacillus saerimneri]|uniref:Helix-turn-helix domain-containing protein n=1 Tax=Ligilactobacillus saerimneri TaxID=228229 RepID=A0A7H9EMT9_9LACO|nr:helix-turn-helix transcriptional regulator [Ligilactobacillus saerimneri]QLL78831.1 helix-turn-helix domain-containing protein [Ligilactobacillus saerimneri]
MWIKIEKRIKEQGISIYKLSKITGIPNATFYNYRNGSEPSFKNMCKIADALDVSLDYFREEERK